MRNMAVLLVMLTCLPMSSTGQGNDAWEKVRRQFDTGRYYAGIRGCDRMLSRKHQDSTFLVLRAEGNNNIAAYERAMRDATQAIDVVDGDLQRAAFVQLGLALLHLGHPDSARHWFTASLGGTDDGEALYRLGVLDRMARNCEGALSYFDRVIELHPDHAAAYRDRGGCKAELGDMASAAADLDRAIELAPRDPVAWNARGYDLHARNGKWKEAIADYDRAIKFDPNYSFAFNNRGWAYYKLGNKDKALKEIALAGRKKRTNPFVFRNLGIIALEGGEIERACSYFGQALELNFTIMHGPEVEDMMRTHCGSKEPLRPSPRLGEPASAPPSNAPSGGQEPQRGNAP